MMGKQGTRLRDLEEVYDRVLSEKLELEYKCRELERGYIHEKAQRDEILSLHENAGKLKHDMKNHIMVINAYLQEDDVDNAKEYLSEILDKEDMQAFPAVYMYIAPAVGIVLYLLSYIFWRISVRFYKSTGN